MAEMAIEDENKDMEDDNDFVNDKSAPTSAPFSFFAFLLT